MRELERNPVQIAKNIFAHAREKDVFALIGDAGDVCHFIAAKGDSDLIGSPQAEGSLAFVNEEDLFAEISSHDVYSETNQNTESAVQVLLLLWPIVKEILKRRGIL